MMIRENYQDFLLPILRKIFDKHIGEMKDFIPTLYTVESSSKAQEFNHGLGSMGMMKEWNESGGQVYYDNVRKGFKATYTHEKYSIGLQIERELLDDALYSEIKSRTKKIASSVYYTRQLHAHRPFNEALTMLGPDGKPLCATDHPVGPHSDATWSNYSTAKPLTPDNVEWARNAMKEWKDDSGNLLLMNPDTIIVPKELRKVAKMVADTDNEPFTTDHGVNIWKGALDVIELDFLTDSSMWFMVDKRRMSEFLKWFERRKAEVKKDDENFSTEVHRFKAVGRWSFGWDDPSFVYGLKTV